MLSVYSLIGNDSVNDFRSIFFVIIWLANLETKYFTERVLCPGSKAWLGNIKEKSLGYVERGEILPKRKCWLTCNV